MINPTRSTLRGLTQFRGLLHSGTNFQSRLIGISNCNYNSSAEQGSSSSASVCVPNYNPTLLESTSGVPPPYLLLGHGHTKPSKIHEAISPLISQRSLDIPSPSAILNYANPQPQPQKSPIDSSSREKPKSPPSGKPSLDQIMNVYNVLQETLPKLFIQPMNYTIYSQDIVFINNISNKTTYGLMKYVQQVALLRTVGHFKFAFVRFEIVSMSQDVEEGRIIVKWRIAGISGLRVMFKFWKYRLWKWAEIMKQQETWYDGISYYDVGADGLIFRHIADKVEEDKDRVIETKAEPNTLAPKLAMMNPTTNPMNSFQSAYLTAGKKYRKYVDSDICSKRSKRLSYV